MRPFIAFSALLILSITCVSAPSQAAPAHSPAGSSKSAESPVIVLGFVGGYVHHDDTLHTEVQLAARLREAFPTDTYTDVIENHKGDEAYSEILNLLDSDHDGSLSADEKSNARIILYGHSWGASQLVALARQLQKDSIPVLLTIQVDSVMKHHIDDQLIPANVAEAANFYQPDSILHGRSEIRAADPRHTKILGNFRFDYKEKPITCADNYPWLVRHFAKPHVEIECDPNVWTRVENLIRSQLHHAPASTPSAEVAVQTVRQD